MSRTGPRGHGPGARAPGGRVPEAPEAPEVPEAPEAVDSAEAVRTAVAAEAAEADADRYLRTDGVRSDLRGRSIRSGFQQLVSQAVQFLMMIASAMLLARLLTPEHFGLYAMVQSLTAFVVSFRDFGFVMATVQREELTHHQASALFWLSQRLSAALALLVGIAAPLLAAFYGDPRLTAMALVMAAAIGVQGSSVMHQGLLVRQMRFDAQVWIDLSSMGLSIAVSVAAALAGAGYWALVIQFVVYSVVRSAGYWLACGWRPLSYARSRGAPDVGAMISFGAYLTAHRILTHVGRNVDRVLVGYFRGATVVGLYDNAYRWSLATLEQLFAPLNHVVVSTLSRVQNDPDAYRRSARGAMLPTLSLVMPTMAFLAVEAEAAILVLLGDQWRPAVPLFRVLCIAAFASAVLRVLKWLYISLGQTRRQFHWSLAYSPVMITAVALGVRWGAYGVAIAFTIATVVMTVPGVAYCLHASPLRWRDFVPVVARPALAAGAAAWAITMTRPELPTMPMLWQLVVQALIYAPIYLMAWIALPGGRGAAHELLQLVRELLPADGPPRPGA